MMSETLRYRQSARRTVRAASAAIRSKSGVPFLTWPSTAFAGSGSRAAPHSEQGLDLDVSNG